MDAIFDRTEQDIIEKTSKAYLNASDLNRIENNCVELADLLGVTGLQIKTDWKRLDFPDTGELQRIIENVADLREAWHTYPDTPQIPEGMRQWQQLNDLERILWDVYRLRVDNNNSVSYSGEFFAGERGLL